MDIDNNQENQEVIIVERPQAAGNDDNPDNNPNKNNLKDIPDIFYADF